jgi:methylenetetrahydrofolate reductase (NADPH)
MVDRGLHAVERLVKAPVVGCQTCGFCRLPYTAYVCPETCPKGLANGPCGGTSENTCEFGDRECIHNRKYRIAKEAGRLDELEALLIPAVDADKRGTCSWTNHFRGEDPAVVRLTDIRPKGNRA